MRLDHEEDEMPTRGEQASAWCVRLATGSLTPTEQAAFDSWLDTEPANAKAFDQALNVWQGLHAISDTPEIISQRADALNALRRANRERWSRNITRWPPGLGIAASLLLVMVSSLLLFTHTASRPDTYSTGMGERRALVLADGSRLSLDAETRVSVLFERNRRALTLLAGRAKFDVAKDAGRPFTVTAGDRTVVATGTAFSVELLGDQVHVILYEGHVAVLKGGTMPAQALLRVKAHPDGKATRLSPGDELITDIALATQPRIVATDIARSLAWEGGQLNFVHEPLASAVERLNRYSANKLVIGDAVTADIRVNGVFNAGDSAAFAEAMSAAYSIRVEHVGSDIILASPTS